MQDNDDNAVFEVKTVRHAVDRLLSAGVCKHAMCLVLFARDVDKDGNWHEYRREVVRQLEEEDARDVLGIVATLEDALRGRLRELEQGATEAPF